MRNAKPTNNQNIAEFLFQNGSTQIAVMVGIVTTISQALAQLGINPLHSAVVFSLLLALYQVTIVQKARGSECVLLVPLATGILFSMSLGTNNLVVGLKTGERSESTKSLQEMQIKNLEQQLANEKLANDLLRRLATLSPASEGNSQATAGPSARENSPASPLSSISKFFIGDAFGQEKSLAVKPLSEAERKKILDKLQVYQLEQKKLQTEAKVLREQAQQKSEAQTSPLWKKW